MNKRIGTLIALAVLGTAVNVAAADYKQMIRNDIEGFQSTIDQFEGMEKKGIGLMAPMSISLQRASRKLSHAQEALQKLSAGQDPQAVYTDYQNKLKAVDSEVRDPRLPGGLEHHGKWF